MESKIIRIVTEDTGKTYEFPNGGNPPLWGVKLEIAQVDPFGSTPFNYQRIVSKIIHVERSTLEKAGLNPLLKKNKDELEPAIETIEDLIIRLLEHVGVYPTE